ncbi:hypothetical protein WDU94_013707 [Cyamophila willieti]
MRVLFAFVLVAVVVVTLTEAVTKLGPGVGNESDSSAVDCSYCVSTKVFVIEMYTRATYLEVLSCNGVKIPMGNTSGTKHFHRFQKMVPSCCPRLHNIRGVSAWLPKLVHSAHDVIQ